MALNPQITFIGSDRTGTTLTIEDSTGGYLTPENIERVLVNIKNIYGFDEIENHVRSKILASDLIYPPLDNILDGVPFTITSTTLGMTGTSQPLDYFCDGVYDILYSVVEIGEYEGTGQSGSYLLFSTDTDDFLNYDIIYSEGHAYRIDKSKDTIAGSVLYLLDELKTDVTEFQLGYQGFNKFFMDIQALSKTVLATGISADNNGAYKYDVLEAQSYRIAAREAFDEGDIETADNFILYSNKIVGRLI